MYGLKSYLPEGYNDPSDDETEELITHHLRRYAPQVIVSWIEPDKEINLEELSEQIHIQCTKCKFCDGDRNSHAIKTNEPILLCELKGCNREYHLHCLPKGLLVGRDKKEKGHDIVVDGSHEHIVYIDKDPTGEEEEEDGEEEEGIPPGEIYCKECVAEGSSTVLKQYFRRCDEIRRHYSCSRDYVLSLLERHMLDNPSGNIVDAAGEDVSPDEEMEEVHLKPPPRSELWYVEEMNKMARTNPFEKEGDTAVLVPERTDGGKDEYTIADFLIGKPVRLYCNLDNEYHNGRIIDWRTSTVYPNSDVEKSCKSKEKTVHLTKLDFYGSGPVSACEFLVRFPANEGRRKKEVEQWIILEEHSIAVGITLVKGQYDSKSTSSEKWRPAIVLARSALELVPVREFLQEGKDGELFGRKKLEEAESGVSAADDLLALSSFFGGKEHEVLNLRTEVKGLITYDLLKKYHVNEELEGKKDTTKEGDASLGAGAVGDDGAAAAKPRRLSIPIPPKMGLALNEYKEQYYCYEQYKTLSSPMPIALLEDKDSKEDGVADEMQIDELVDEQKPDATISQSQATKTDENETNIPSLQPVDDDMMEMDGSASDRVNKTEEKDLMEATLDDKEKSGELNTSETTADQSKEIGNEGEVAVSVADKSPEPEIPNDENTMSGDESNLGIDIEEEVDEDIYADYDIVEIYEDDESTSSEDVMSVDSGIESTEGFNQRDSYSRKSSNGSQTGKMARNRERLSAENRSRKTENGSIVDRGQTVIGGRRVEVDVVRTGSRGRPRHVNVSPESKYAPFAEEFESRKRPPPVSRAEPEPKKPASKPPAPKPKPAPKPPTPEPESDNDNFVIPMPADLPKGITQRPSGKWVSQHFLDLSFRFLQILCAFPFTIRSKLNCTMPESLVTWVCSRTRRMPSRLTKLLVVF